MTSPFAPECEALQDVAESARAQLDALRTGSPESFESAAARTLDAVAELDRRRTARAHRMTSTHATASPDQRAALEASAAEARAACDELEIALHHAVELGRDLIGAWQQMAQPATAHVYTANGTVGAASAAGPVRQIG